MRSMNALQKTLPERATAPAKGATPSIQVNGILNELVDGLWEEGDRYFHDGDYIRTIALARICVELDHSFDEAYSSGAYLLWSLGDVPAANAFLDYGVKHSTRPGSLHNEMGQHLFRLKRYPEATTYLKKAVALGGVTVTAYSTLAHCYTRQNKFAEAVEAWKVVVAKFPDFPAGPKNLKDAQERLKAGK